MEQEYAEVVKQHDTHRDSAAELTATLTELKDTQE